MKYCRLLIIILCVIFISASQGCTLSTSNDIGDASTTSNDIVCTRNSADKSSPDIDELCNWVGNYEYFDSCADYICYEIQIYAESDSYFAEIDIDGFQTTQRIKANIQGDRNSISFLFDFYLPNSVNQVYKKGDKLLSFTRNSSDILTDWGKIELPSDSIKQKNGIYFETVPLSQEKSIPSSSGTTDVSTWTGLYTFSEYAPPDLNMSYGVLIYNKNGKYYANIMIDGHMTLIRIKAEIQGDQNSIDLIMERNAYGDGTNLIKDYGGEDSYYRKGDIILRLEKKNSKLYTEWKKLKPMITQNEVTSVCFKKKQS